MNMHCSVRAGHEARAARSVFQSLTARCAQWRSLQRVAWLYRRGAVPQISAMGCAAQAPGGVGPLPGASRSMGSLGLKSSFFGAGRWGGCFQMSGSCRRGWYTDSSELSSLPALHAPKTHSEAL